MLKMEKCGKCHRKATLFMIIFVEDVHGSGLFTLCSCADCQSKHDEEMDKDFYTAMSSWCESSEEAELASIRGPSSLEKGVSGIVYHVRDFIPEE